jgi:hypothetical protein
VKISLLEIYNEQIFDLLTQSRGIQGCITAVARKAARCRRRYLSLREVNGKVVVENLTAHAASTPREALKIVQNGSKNRHLASTNLNSQSSRSHCVCSIELTNQHGPLSLAPRPPFMTASLPPAQA